MDGLTSLLDDHGYMVVFFIWSNLPRFVTNTYIFPFYRQISREIFMKIMRESSAYFLRKYKKKK